MIIVLLACFIPAIAQSPFVVYKASRGVELQSINRGKVIVNKDPVRGTPVFKEDKFILNDDRYFVKIKDKKGEIYSWSGKGTVSPLDIVAQHKFNVFDSFFNLLLDTSRELGFNITPVHTTQCVTHKGGQDISVENEFDSLSNAIATAIAQDIHENNYFQKVNVKREWCDEESYNFSLENNDSLLYAFVLYTVSKDCISKHDDVIVREDGYIRPSKIEFNQIYEGSTLKLDYFTMSSADEEDDRTCYVILFKPTDLYKDIISDFYNFKRLINWTIIEKELIYQGNVDRVLLIR